MHFDRKMRLRDAGGQSLAVNHDFGFFPLFHNAICRSAHQDRDCLGIFLTAITVFQVARD